MPEQLTKHPDVTLQVLRSAGARCGEGLPQEILKSCPPARFCKLPGGELCVYGLAEARTMTQVTPAEWRAVAGEAPGSGLAPAALAALAVTALVLAGLLAAVVVRWRRRGKP